MVYDRESARCLVSFAVGCSGTHRDVNGYNMDANGCKWMKRDAKRCRWMQRDSVGCLVSSAVGRSGLQWDAVGRIET